jgi:hypothetical protein
VPKNRSIIILAISMAVLLGTECGVNYSAHPPTPKPIERHRYRFVLPDNYVGWVRIDLGVPKAEPWQMEQDTVTVTIPESGIKQTESELYTMADVLLYYQHAGDLVRVPDSMYDHYVLANGVTVPLKWGRWGLKKGTWYLFVGPQSLRGHYPAIMLNSNATAPTPGRMATPSTEHLPVPSPNL